MAEVLPATGAAAGAAGGGPPGGPGGEEPPEKKPEKEAPGAEEPDKEEEEVESDEENIPGGLRPCKKSRGGCGKLGYLRKWACVNPKCVGTLFESSTVF